MKRYILILMAIVSLFIYGCSGGSGDSSSVASADVAKVTFSADFSGGSVTTAFVKDIDSIVIEYQAGCSGNRTLFEYLFVDNGSNWEEYDNSSIAFWKTLEDLYYDLWRDAYIEMLDNGTVTNTNYKTYYQKNQMWYTESYSGVNCRFKDYVTLSKDNNTATITLTPGYAYFVIKFIKNNNVIDKVATAGNLNRGDNTVTVSSVRGTWKFATPFRTMDVAQEKGFDNISQLHIAMVGKADFGFLYKSIFKEEISEYTSTQGDNMTEVGYIQRKYLDLVHILPNTDNITGYTGVPYKSNYYYGILEYGSGDNINGLPMFLSMTRQFTGGTGTGTNWNGLMTTGDSVEIDLDNGSIYEFMILGFAPNIDNNTMVILSPTPLTTVNGDNMSGMAVESILTYSQKCEILDNTSKWISVNCIDNNNNQMQPTFIQTSALKAAKKIGKVSKAGIITSEGCVDNVTDTWVDLEHYDSLCKNGQELQQPGWHWYNNKYNRCPQEYTEIYDVYIKTTKTTKGKYCLKSFTATRQANFDLSNLKAEVDIIISNKK